MKKTYAYSPLRYPGGKAVIANYLSSIIQLNQINDCTYFELYAGGAGAALNLLFSNTVRRIVLNDADFHIYAFWKIILDDTQRLIEKIDSIDINIDEWHIQKNIYDNPDGFSVFEIGFSTFFLNRCNRSGILSKAGPIGGLNQTGTYKIDARFNKQNQINRIRKIAENKSNIEIYNLDALSFIKQNSERIKSTSSFLYLDPPYYKKGRFLYLNFFTHKDHEELRDLLSENKDVNWMVSYDDAKEIHELYKLFKTSTFDISYTLQSKRKTQEFLIFSDSLKLSPNE